MITFYNDGLIDMTAVTTFGVSAKENKSPIGYFGTGLKYAIAIVLRNGGRVRLWRGNEKFDFTAQQTSVRDQEFHVVHMNGQPLGFTTHMGVNWRVWQAFRELYCNALDEGGSATSSHVEPSDNTTLLQVWNCEEFEGAYERRDTIVLSSKPKQQMAGCEVHPGKSDGVYYRGILAAALEEPAFFTYNITHGLMLTEDRTIKHMFEAESVIAEAILRSQDTDFLKEWLTSPKGTFEYSLSLKRGALPSEEFLDVVNELRLKMDTPFNPSALNVYYDNRGAGSEYTSIELNEVESEQLNRAIAFLGRMNYHIDQSSLVIVDSLGSGVMGMANHKEQKIFISRRAFEMGTKYLASTMLEEHLHLKYMYQDCTRDFQSYLLDRLVTLAEQHVLKEPL